jgi:hypothetical protein
MSLRGRRRERLRLSPALACDAGRGAMRCLRSHRALHARLSVSTAEHLACQLQIFPWRQEVAAARRASKRKRGRFHRRILGPKSREVPVGIRRRAALRPEQMGRRGNAVHEVNARWHRELAATFNCCGYADDPRGSHPPSPPPTQLMEGLIRGGRGVCPRDNNNNNNNNNLIPARFLKIPATFQKLPANIKNSPQKAPRIILF